MCKGVGLVCRGGAQCVRGHGSVCRGGTWCVRGCGSVCMGGARCVAAGLSVYQVQTCCRAIGEQDRPLLAVAHRTRPQGCSVRGLSFCMLCRERGEGERGEEERKGGTERGWERGRKGEREGRGREKRGTERGGERGGEGGGRERGRKGGGGGEGGGREKRGERERERGRERKTDERREGSIMQCTGSQALTHTDAGQYCIAETHKHVWKGLGTCHSDALIFVQEKHFRCHVFSSG